MYVCVCERSVVWLLNKAPPVSRFEKAAKEKKKLLFFRLFLGYLGFETVGIKGLDIITIDANIT